MKHQKFIIPLTALAVLTATSLPFVTQAAAKTTKTKTKANITLTDAQKTELEQKMAARKAAMETAQAEINKAIEAGDYDAWVKAVGTGNYLTKTITKDNFSKYQEIYNLHQQIKNLQDQVDQKMTDLGLDKGGFGQGMGDAHGRGPGRGMGVMMTESAQ